jgi:predicted metal-dependent hydrolase
MARDRDEQGRARNARPRDAAGRPLPRGADGVDRVPEDLVLEPDEAVTEAQRLLDEGLPFQAHEVLEGVWKASGPPTRELWRALAQVAVGLTHAQRGNARGAVSLLERGAEGVRTWRAGATVPTPAGLDLDALTRHADELVERIGTDGEASEGSLRPRLRG